MIQVTKPQYAVVIKQSCIYIRRLLFAKEETNEVAYYVVSPSYDKVVTLESSFSAYFIDYIIVDEEDLPLFIQQLCEQRYAEGHAIETIFSQSPKFIEAARSFFDFDIEVKIDI